MTEQPLTFQSKSKLLSDAPLTDPIDTQPSTCVDAEPYALQVLDDSMAPEFWPGCIILIDPTGRVTNGSYVLAMVGESGSNEFADLASNSRSEQYVFRQLRRHNDECWTLDALGENYASLEIDKSFNNIVGVIVQRAGKRRHQHKRYD